MRDAWHGLGCLALCALCACARPAVALDLHRDDVKRFIGEVSGKDSISKRRLRKLLKAAKSQPAIIEAMNRPAEKARLWYEYRPIFLTEKRIREGTDFWIAHRLELDRASVKSGVAPEYLAAIVGIETFYGRLTGSYRVLDALATLAFDYPARAKFFRDELEQFILLSRDTGLDPLVVKGSYAGAMGAPQFMPSSYRRYAVDANADGHIDLWGNWSDVCASVGNYLKEQGWNPGEPVLSEAAVDADKTAELDGHTLSLVDTVGSLKSKGVNFDSSLPPDAPALLIAADESDGVHWRVGYNNFYVITRYNHSALYAMAVYELAAAVKQGVLAHDNTSAAAPGDPAAAATAAAGAQTPAAARTLATAQIPAAPDQALAAAQTRATAQTPAAAQTHATAQTPAAPDQAPAAAQTRATAQTPAAPDQAPAAARTLATAQPPAAPDQTPAVAQTPAASEMPSAAAVQRRSSEP